MAMEVVRLDWCTSKVRWTWAGGGELA